MGDCLGSIAAQTSRDFELIIVDDCSADGTRERINAWVASADIPTLPIFHDVSWGLCASLNEALGHATGEFLSYVSADDTYEPTKIERQLALFAAVGHAAAVVYADVATIDQNGVEIRNTWFPKGMIPPAGRVFEQLICYTNFVPSASAMVRRSAIDEVGGYDETLVYEDFDMWLRLSERYEFAFLPERVAAWRLLATSLSQNPARLAEIRLSRSLALLKWYGYRPELDDAILHRVWAMGRRTLHQDPIAARKMLGMVVERRPSFVRRSLVAASYLPGSGRAVESIVGLRARLRDLS